MDGSFEDGMKRLEAIRQQLDAEEVSLEEMVRLYKEGMELSKKLSQTLDLTEKEVIRIEESMNHE